MLMPRHRTYLQFLNNAIFHLLLNILTGSCSTGIGYSCTTRYAMRRSANDLFTDLLDSLRISFCVMEDAKLQLAKYFNNHYNNRDSHKIKLKAQSVSLEEKMEACQLVVT